MSTTVVNAYIGPKVGGYVKSLKSSLGGIGFKGDLSIMRSNGGVMTPEVATERPVAMMESGPVGGIIASAQVGLALGFPNVISFDMGGTTAKTSLIREGETDAGARLLRRRLRQRPSGDAADDRRGRGRRRRRLDRLDRRHRRAQGRPAERGRRSRPDLLSRRRHRADHHRRQRGARPARPGQFPRRHDEARRRRRAARHRAEDRRAAEARHDRGGAGDRRHLDQQDVACGARGVGRQGLRPARLRAGRLRRRGAAACLRDRPRAVTSRR